MSNSFTHYMSTLKRLPNLPNYCRVRALQIHNFIDSSKIAYANYEHRALFHHTLGLEVFLDIYPELEEFTKEFALTADGCEADDLCGIYSNVCLKEGKLPIICHIDKDLNQIPGLHYNYRHKHEHKYKVSCEDAYHMMLRQCLSGDRTDNIKGIPGIGEVKGNAILEGLDHKDYLDKVLATWQH